ncbi:MAG: two pore domain potassium channel family protein [Chloroflexia bacterium]|nr:two pore domain potassium channel family protein [Chloroflexia bacterium]
MTVLLTVLGVALIGVALRDIFHTLFAPTGSGSISSLTARHIWRLFRRWARRRPDVLTLAGPLALLLIIALWTLALTIGWALVLWPHLADAFLLSATERPEEDHGFVDAVYISLVTLSTLGYGDITPVSDWMRIVAPLEALIGFALMTASISWILSIYPVLSRRRHLAREVFLLQRTERQTGVTTTNMSQGTLESILMDLTQRTINLRNDLAQFPITYYFHTPDRGSAIEVALLEIAALARASCDHGSPAVRLCAALLLEALTDLATHVGEAFLDRDTGSLDDLLAAYAADHSHPLERDVREGDIAGEYHAER